jgi:hypothetical protein
MQFFRKVQVDEFLKSKNIKPKFKENILVESNPVNLNLISPKGTRSTITGVVKVTQNKEGVRNELPKLLDDLKRKVENKNPQILIKNKYKLFIEDYEK